jgi:hypothetical protein
LPQAYYTRPAEAVLLGRLCEHIIASEAKQSQHGRRLLRRAVRSSYDIGFAPPKWLFFGAIFDRPASPLGDFLTFACIFRTSVRYWATGNAKNEHCLLKGYPSERMPDDH